MHGLNTTCNILDSKVLLFFVSRNDSFGVLGLSSCVIDSFVFESSVVFCCTEISSGVDESLSMIAR